MSDQSLCKAFDSRLASESVLTLRLSISLFVASKTMPDGGKHTILACTSLDISIMLLSAAGGPELVLVALER